MIAVPLVWCGDHQLEIQEQIAFVEIDRSAQGHRVVDKAISHHSVIYCFEAEANYESAMSSVSVLILANVVVYLLELTMSPEFEVSLALWPLGGGFMPWQLLSYAFLHANFSHLAVNMFGLWMFGRDVEAVLDKAGMFKLYFVSVVSAAVTQLLVAATTGDHYATVGASGGVFGVLLAYAVYFPRRIIVLLFPPIPMPAWLFVSLYAIFELVVGVMGTEVRVAHFAHLGGMVGAYAVVRRQR